jgi:hypothetical protein
MLGVTRHSYMDRTWNNLKTKFDKGNACYILDRFPHANPPDSLILWHPIGASAIGNTNYRQIGALNDFWLMSWKSREEARPYARILPTEWILKIDIVRI